MTLLPYIEAPLHIQFHALAATIAVLIGPIALYRKRRDRLHKIVGYIWITAMLIVATTAFFIHSFAVIGPFSPIHGFAILTYWSIYTAMRHVFAGRIHEHQLALRNLYWFGLIIAGLANFLPGRTTNRTFFGDAPEMGYVFIAVVATLLIAFAVYRRRLAPAPLAQV